MKNVGNVLSLTTLKFKLSKLSPTARFTWPRELGCRIKKLGTFAGFEVFQKLLII